MEKTYKLDDVEVSEQEFQDEMWLNRDPSWSPEEDIK
jgi:hypothetical protein